MGKKTYHLFTILGIPIKLDLSWILILALVTWTAAVGYFPLQTPGLEARIYWGMGLVAALLLFLSILLHEMSHALVARYFRIPVRGITLFVFGGAAEMLEEPPTARSELFMAAAGPLASLTLSALFWLILQAGHDILADPLKGILTYLTLVNLMLAIFNLAPGFPLDGGRIMRAVLWRVWGNLRKATRLASQFGSAFGILLIIGGLLQAFYVNNLIGGFWMALIGLFLKNAAESSYQQLRIREVLSGLKVSDIMTREVSSVPASVSLEVLFRDYIFATGHNKFPVEQDCRLVGVVSIRDFRDIGRERWPEVTVASVMKPVEEHVTLSPTDDALGAFRILATSDVAQIPVEVDGCLRGVITRRDLMQKLGIQLEMNGE